jgi:serine O-acetyltransferase
MARECAAMSSRRKTEAPARARQPQLRTALLEDTRVSCALRGERFEFSSRLDGVLQMLRLALVSDAFGAQVAYRLGSTLRARRVPLLPRLLQRIAIASAAIYIGEDVRLQPGVYIVHGQVVLQGAVEVGRRTVISPAVTVASGAGEGERITIAPGVSLGTGSRVLGDLTIGPRAHIGAGSVVLSDVPAGTTVVGIPARPTKAADGLAQG